MLVRMIRQIMCWRLEACRDVWVVENLVAKGCEEEKVILVGRWLLVLFGYGVGLPNGPFAFPFVGKLIGLRLRVGVDWGVCWFVRGVCPTVELASFTAVEGLANPVVE